MATQCKSSPSNPFIVGLYVSDLYFRDREEETQYLIE